MVHAAIKAAPRALLLSLSKQLSSSPSSVTPWIQRRLSDPRHPRPSFLTLTSIFNHLLSHSPSPAALDAATSIYYRMTVSEGYETRFLTDAQMLVLALRAEESLSGQVASALRYMFSHPSKFTNNDFLSLAWLMESLSFSPTQLLQITRLYVDLQQPSLGVTTLLARLLADTSQHDEALDLVSQYSRTRGRKQASNGKVSASHPFTAALSVSPSSQPPSPAHIDNTLATMSSLSIPSDRSLLNVLILDQAMRARDAGKHAFAPRSASGSQVNSLSVEDDPSSITSLWDSISRPKSQSSAKQLRQNAHLAVEKAFAIYDALCQAHADSEVESGEVTSGKSNESKHRPCFRPDFFTYRVLWDLLARRPGWKFQKRNNRSQSLTRSGAGVSLRDQAGTDKKGNPDKIEKTFLTSTSVDEYGFDLSEESEFDSDEDDLDATSGELGTPSISASNSETSICGQGDSNTQFSSTILTPRALFHDMMKYHFSAVPASFKSPPKTQSKNSAQNQLLLNTALTTFLNRSTSAGGPDYAAAIVVLRCFFSPRVGHLGHNAEKALVPSIPLPLRTYRIVFTHLHQRVRDSLRHSLGHGKKKRKRRSPRVTAESTETSESNGGAAAGELDRRLTTFGNLWARWVLSMGAGDLRGFRELLSRPNEKHGSLNLTRLTMDPDVNEWQIKGNSRPKQVSKRELSESNEGIVAVKDPPPHPLPPRPETAFEKITARMLVVSQMPLASALSPNPHRRVKPKGEDGAGPTFDVVTGTRAERAKGNENAHSQIGFGVPSEQLGKGQGSPEDLERLLVRAWIVTNYNKHVDIIRSSVSASVKQDEYDEYELSELLRIFEREVGSAMGEMVPV
ncbi:hypothetical protein GYMLUDRAFT_46351 [Collybiopsis luxurians FD-317 M1]|uniref:Uncharacterized protein n=1 Tax=Collybiopsis luxurians FD-317 M1 TaxID=944289 RepID=A0A0D0CPZ7_9AGAR|nr:hypothetical protein GYMLUDRAFT_46351 [Collybiopsis luxurians FD-317 M1]